MTRSVRPGAENRGERDREQEAGKCEDDVDEAHHEGIDALAGERRRSSDDAADH